MLSPTSKSTSVVSTSGDRGGATATTGTRPRLAVDQGFQASKGPMAALVKQMMTNESARHKLMRLAETIVTVSHTSDKHDSVQLQHQLQHQSEEKELAIRGSFASVTNNNNDSHVDARCVTGIPTSANQNAAAVDEQTWADMLGLSDCEAITTATTTPSTSPAAIAPTTATAVAEAAVTTDLRPMLDVGKCNQCGFELCMCSWADLCLAQAWTHPECGPGSSNISTGSSTSSSSSPRAILNPLEPQQPSFGWWNKE